MPFKPTARPKYYDFVNGPGAVLPFTFTPTAGAVGPIFTGGTQTVIATLPLQHIRGNDRQNLELTVQARFTSTITPPAATAPATAFAVALSVGVRYRIFRDLASSSPVTGGVLVADFQDTYSATFTLTAAGAAIETISGTTTITGTDINAFPPLGQESATHVYYATAEVTAVGILPGVTVGGATFALTPASAVTATPLHFAGIVLDENEFENV